MIATALEACLLATRSAHGDAPSGGACARQPGTRSFFCVGLPRVPTRHTPHCGWFSRQTKVSIVYSRMGTVQSSPLPRIPPHTLPTHGTHASASVVEVLRSFFTSVFSRPHPPTNTCCCGTCGTYGHRCRCFILVFCFWCARMRAWCSARPAQWHAHAPPIPLCTHARTFFCRHHRFAVVLPAHVAGGRPARLKSPA